MSGLGFNYTELDLNEFSRWYPQDKYATMLVDCWQNWSFNPFVDGAKSGNWSRWTMISPPSTEKQQNSGVNQYGESNGTEINTYDHRPVAAVLLHKNSTTKGTPIWRLCCAFLTTRMIDFT